MHNNHTIPKEDPEQASFLQHRFDPRAVESRPLLLVVRAQPLRNKRCEGSIESVLDSFQTVHSTAHDDDGGEGGQNERWFWLNERQQPWMVNRWYPLTLREGNPSVWLMQQWWCACVIAFLWSCGLEVVPIPLQKKVLCTRSIDGPIPAAK